MRSTGFWLIEIFRGDFSAVPRCRLIVPSGCRLLVIHTTTDGHHSIKSLNRKIFQNALRTHDVSHTIGFFSFQFSIFRNLCHTRKSPIVPTKISLQILCWKLYFSLIIRDCECVCLASSARNRTHFPNWKTLMERTMARIDRIFRIDCEMVSRKNQRINLIECLFFKWTVAIRGGHKRNCNWRFLRFQAKIMPSQPDDSNVIGRWSPFETISILILCCCCVSILIANSFSNRELMRRLIQIVDELMNRLMRNAEFDQKMHASA